MKSKPTKLNTSTVIRYDEQAKAFVSYCPPLDLYSQGETREKAMQALCDTIVGWMFGCQMNGVLSETLNVRIRECEEIDESTDPE